MNSWLRPRVSVKMSSSAPDTNSGGQPHKTLDHTEFEFHRKWHANSVTPKKSSHTPTNTPRQTWTIFPGPWSPQSLRGRGQRDKFRRRSEISQKWDDHSSPSRP
uniref:(northern house mosquito) hypothetical protein n=1 Tax=Culex pipiens TaxID=7175 RepID=A0A8D8ANU9_CULPI